MNTHYVGGKMKEYFLNYIDRNIKEVFTITLIIFIGLIIGIIYINNLSYENKLEIENYINDTVDYVKNIEKNNEQIDINLILFDNIKRNFINIMLISIFSSCIIGIPIMYFLIGLKSYSISYTMSCIIATLGTRSGIIFICSSMLLHNIILLIGIYLISISGIDLYKEIIVNKSENIRFKIIRHIIFIIIGVLISIFAALAETFISNNIFLMVKDFI